MVGEAVHVCEGRVYMETLYFGPTLLWHVTTLKISAKTKQTNHSWSITVTSCGATISHLGSVVVPLGDAKCCPWDPDDTMSPSQESNKCVIPIVLQHLIQSSTSLSLGLRHASSGRWRFYSPEGLHRLMNVRTSNVSIAAASGGFWFYVRICPLSRGSSGRLHTSLESWHTPELLCTSPNHNENLGLGAWVPQDQ